MKKMQFGSILLVLAVAVPAFAGVTISSPANGTEVGSPFQLSAWATTCSSQPISAMGYSIDGSTSTAIVYNTSLSTGVSPGQGWHTVHVKAWGNQGAACDTDVAVDVLSSGGTSVVPSGAASVSSIQTMGNWTAIMDTGTGGGGANGYMSIVGSPATSGPAREFATYFSGNGGERYSASFGDDTTSTNFLYDGWVYMTSSSSQIGDLEMDLNQVMPNGETVIFGFQCDGWTSTWDYTLNAGSPQSPSDQWRHSSAYCNPRGWGINAWHHVQIWFSRDGSGNVTYHCVWLDNLQENINATVPSAFALGWAPTLLTNFQVDGYGSSGSSVVYLDDLTVYRW